MLRQDLQTILMFLTVPICSRSSKRVWFVFEILGWKGCQRDNEYQTMALNRYPKANLYLSSHSSLETKNDFPITPAEHWAVYLSDESPSSDFSDIFHMWNSGLVYTAHNWGIYPLPLPENWIIQWTHLPGSCWCNRRIIEKGQISSSDRWLPIMVSPRHPRNASIQKEDANSNTWMGSMTS